MEAPAPTPDETARTAASCPSCRAATATDQRYCLSCGVLVGDRRLDPIALLTAAAAAVPVADPPSGGSPGTPRAVPLAAATAAIVVAGISGMLVTQGGAGNGARAAVVAAATAPAAAPATAEPVAGPVPDSPPQDTGDDPLPAQDTAFEDPLPADPLPVGGDLPPVDPAPVEEAPLDDTGADEDTAEEPAAESTPRVWLLALEGPQAAEAVERIEQQGVRLSGMQAIAADAQANVTALVSGTRPAVVATPGVPGDPAVPGAPAGPAAPGVPGVPGPPAAPDAPGAPGDPTGSGGSDAPGDPTDPSAAATESAPSLPAALKAADRTWRAYVDVQPTTGKVLPGACAAPAADDPAATLLGSRLPFAAIDEIDCETSVTGLETLGNDLSAGEDIPDFSYVAMGGCAAPERTAVALPDAVEDAVSTITSSTEYQEDGMLVVTTVGTRDACSPATLGSTVPAADGVAAAPGATAAPPAGGVAVPGASVPAPAPVPVPGDPATAPGAAPAAPTVVLRPAATAGKAVKAKLDLLTLSRSMAEVLGLTPPGAAGEDAVPALALPGVPKPE